MNQPLHIARDGEGIGFRDPQYETGQRMIVSPDTAFEQVGFGSRIPAIYHRWLQEATAS